MVTLYEVGGAVRDRMIGIQSKDIDYAVEAESFDEMREEILSRDGKIFLETPQYFTIRAHLPKIGAADFVLCRKDGEYSDGRRPDTVEMGTIYDDLARRDFTVNAMAIRESDGELLDPFDGRKDLENCQLACVGKAEERFREDALRMLRALRFALTKNFSLSKSIVECFRSQDMVELLANISIDRIREELTKCFDYNTLLTLEILNRFPMLRTTIFSHENLWLKPTQRG